VRLLRVPVEEGLGTLVQRVDGLIVAPASISHHDHLAAIQQTGTHLVLLDRPSPDVAADAVVIDNRGAARDAVRRLIAAGHRRIAMVAGASAMPGDGDGTSIHPISTVSERIEGYREALVEGGIDPDPRYLRIGGVPTENDRHQKLVAREQTRRLLGMRSRPTAIFALDSVLALGVLEGVQSSRLEIPGQVSVVGFDDADLSSLVTPALTTVRQPLAEMGRMAVSLLTRLLDNQRLEALRVELATRLVVRDSTAPPL
jgi:LacI family transcriptional regulator